MNIFVKEELIFYFKIIADYTFKNFYKTDKQFFVNKIYLSPFFKEKKIICYDFEDVIEFENYEFITVSSIFKSQKIKISNVNEMINFFSNYHDFDKNIYLENMFFYNALYKLPVKEYEEDNNVKSLFYYKGVWDKTLNLNKFKYFLKMNFNKNPNNFVVQSLLLSIKKRDYFYFLNSCMSG